MDMIDSYDDKANVKWNIIKEIIVCKNIILQKRHKNETIKRQD